MSSNDSIFEELRNQVVNGSFEPGQRLRAEKLRETFGCSASTIREMLFRLSTVGLVDFQEQRGFRVPQTSNERQHDLAQFRILLECEGTCLSIRRGGVAWESRLSAAHSKLSHIETRINDYDEAILSLWTAAELEFHQTLIDSCGSEMLKTTHSVVYQQFRQQMIHRDKKMVFIPDNIDQHKAILDAALAHDEALVRKRIHNHLARNLIGSQGLETT